MTAAAHTVVVGDTNRFFEAALKALLGREQRLAWAGCAGSIEALQSLIARERPLLAVVDWELPGGGARRLLQPVAIAEWQAHVVVVADDPRPDIACEALRLGAKGHFLKSDPPECLLEVLASVGRGRMSFPFLDCRLLFDDPFERLTERERSFLAAVADGWTNLKISSRFGVSENTVKFHLKNLYEKLGVDGRSDAASYYRVRFPGGGGTGGPSPSG